MSAPTLSRRAVRVPSAAVLVGGVYAICVVGLLAVFVGQIVFTDVDPHASEGPLNSIVSVGTVGTVALVVGVGLALWLRRTPDRARIGAVVLAALSLLSLVVFWSGAPGIFGACAAWLAGLTRGGRPQPGLARVAGIVGLLVVVLSVVLTVGGVAVSAFVD